MADQKPIVIVETKVDQKPLDKGLDEIKKKVKHSSEENSSVFKEMFAALSLEKLAEKGLEAVTDFFKESVTAAKEAETNTVQLKTALNNLGRGEEFKEITENAEKLSDQFAINKEDLIKSSTALESYGKLTEDQIKQLQPIIIDYAAKTGTSVEESTETIIKGLEGSGRGLKKFGVELKAGASSADNFNQIVGELGPAIQGAGEAAANTSAGKLKKFQNQMEELQVSVGEVIIPLLSDLADQFQPILKQLTPVITSLVEALEPALKALGEVIGVLIKVLLPPLELLFKSISKQLTLASRIINIVVVAVQKFADKLKSLIENSKGASKAFEFFGKIITGITDKIKAAYKWISDLLDKVEDFLGIKHENEPKKAIEEVGEASERVDTKQEELDKKAAKREAAAAKRKEKAANKEIKDEEKADALRRKGIEEHEKSLEELANLKDKYYLTDRDKVGKAFDDDIKKLNDTGIMSEQLYQDILDKKAAALKDFDDQAQKDRDEELQKELDDLTDQNEKEKAANQKKLDDEKAAKLQQISDINGYAQQGIQAASTLNDIADQADQNRLKKGEKLSEETQKRQFKRKQALSLTSAILSTAEGVAKAVAESPETGGLPGSAIAALLGGLQIAKILSTKFSPDGGSSTSTSSSAPSAPSSTISAGQTLGLGSQQPNLQLYNQTPPPQQVYVTQTDIARVNNKVNVIQNRSVLK